jgi:hypothetical protein
MTEHNNDVIGVLVAVMRNNKAGLETVVLAAELIAADARFNLRVSKSEDLSNPTSNALTFLDAYEDLLEQCREAAHEFLAHGNQKQLQNILSEIKQRLEELAR